MAGYDQRITTSTNTPLGGRFSGTGKASLAGGTGSAPSASHIQARAQGMTFTRGQFIRGEVIDLRGHDIKVQLPDSRVLSGSIDDAVQLAIGEQASFRVTEANGSIVSLKLLTDPRAASTELTIDRALEAAGLPKSERNVSVVRALLEEGLSVDKNTIQLMLRQSANLRGVSFHTLAVLHKQGLPMNETNARALDSYLNYEHRIMNLAGRAAEEFTETLNSLMNGGSASEAEMLNNELLNMLFSPDASAASSAALPDTLDALSAFLGRNGGAQAPAGAAMTADAAAAAGENAASLPLSASNLLTQEEMLTLADALEHAGLSSGESARIANGSAALREAAMQILTLGDRLLHAGAETSDAAGAAPAAGNGSVPENTALSPETAAQSPLSAEASDNTGSEDAAVQSPDISEELSGAAANTSAQPSSVTSLFRSLLHSAGSLFSREGTAAPEASARQAPSLLAMTLPDAIARLPLSLQTPEVYTLLNQYAGLCLSRSELAAFLPKEKRLELESLLKGKLPESALKQLRDGEITVEELLSLLAEAEENDSGGSSSYLASDAYQEILKRLLKDRFSLKPEALTKKNGIADFYARLDRDLSFIEKLPSRSADAPAFQDTAAAIRENIDFMKALNQLFPYVQLPLKLSGRNAHAELYVYKRRSASGNPSGTPRVLLHLDMEHLGPLDIHLSLADSLVQARFYLPDALSASVTSENMSEFAAMLQKKGYTLDARVEKRTQNTNPVKDLLSPETDNASMKRYSFDIRA